MIRLCEEASALGSGENSDHKFWIPVINPKFVGGKLRNQINLKLYILLALQKFSSQFIYLFTLKKKCLIQVKVEIQRSEMLM